MIGGANIKVELDARLVRAIAKRENVGSKGVGEAIKRLLEENITGFKELVEESVTRCPFCEHQIDELEVRQYGYNISKFDGSGQVYKDFITQNKESFLDSGERYHCPWCNEMLFDNIKDAYNFIYFGKLSQDLRARAISHKISNENERNRNNK